MGILQGDAKIDFVGRSGLFAMISAAAVGLSIVAMALFGLNFGIDFSGGYEIQVKFPSVVSETQIRELIGPAGFGDARIQQFGAPEDNEYLIMVRDHTSLTDEQKSTLKSTFESLAGGADKLQSLAVADSGERLTVAFTQPVSEEQVRQVLVGMGLQIQSIMMGERQDRPEYVVELISVSDQIESALRKGLSIPQDVSVIGRVEFVGPQVGEQLRNQGFMAVVYALGFILLYIAIRFDLYFSPGAVIALIHDVLITMGVFAVFQLEFNLPIVAALLALVGYSLNDTIVVYDRIRENVVRMRGRDLRALVNSSINQTLSRTLLTSGTTLLVVVALLVFGGGIIRDFSIALFVGIVVGTYSSIAIASPIYIWLRERSTKKVAISNSPSSSSNSSTALA